MRIGTVRITGHTAKCCLGIVKKKIPIHRNKIKVTTQVVMMDGRGNYEIREAREKGTQIIFNEESYKIIRAFFEVYKKKGNRFLEAVKPLADKH